VRGLLVSLAGMLRWPATWPLWLAAVSTDPSYRAWRQQQGRRVDNSAWVVTSTMALAGAWAIGKRLHGAIGWGLPWVQSMATLLLHLVALFGAHVLLAAAGERLRGRREAVVVAFAAARAAACVAGVLGLLPIPVMWGGQRAAVVVHGVLRPSLLQVLLPVAGTRCTPQSECSSILR
jgi:hypothetical protein